MKIGVCLKEVPASDARIRVRDDGTGILTDEIKWEISAYDEYALEAALQLKDQGKADHVVILTVGSSHAEARIKDGLARGADSAVRLDDPAFEGSDALGTARILAAAARKAEVGLLLCGRQAIDDDNAQVPAMIAELLGWPQVLVISELELGDGDLTAHRACGGGASQVVHAALPAVLSCDKGLNTPRFASLRGIMMARRKKIQVWGAGDLDLDPSTVGAAGALVQEMEWAPPPPRPAGRIVEGADLPSSVHELVRLLREEAKVI